MLLLLLLSEGDFSSTVRCVLRGFARVFSLRVVERFFFFAFFGGWYGVVRSTTRRLLRDGGEDDEDDDEMT